MVANIMSVEDYEVLRESYKNWIKKKSQIVSNTASNKIDLNKVTY